MHVQQTLPIGDNLEIVWYINTEGGVVISGQWRSRQFVQILCRWLRLMVLMTAQVNAQLPRPMFFNVSCETLKNMGRPGYEAVVHKAEQI